jgi:hypothetical protein
MNAPHLIEQLHNHAQAQAALNVMFEAFRSA